jgi:HNH endonuclease
MTNTEIRVFKSKARQANRPHRVPTDDGLWITVIPQPQLTWSDTHDVMVNASGKCYWCGKPVWLNGTLEHITRIASGGNNDKDNLTWACLPCNQKGYYRD